MADLSDPGSRRSPVAVSARKSAILSRRLVERTSNRRSAPCAAKARATWLPTNPVAPVMKAFMLCYYPERNEGTLSQQIGRPRMWQTKPNYILASLLIGDHPRNQR